MAQSTVSIMYRNSAQKIDRAMSNSCSTRSSRTRGRPLPPCSSTRRTPELWLPRRIATLKPYWTPCSSCRRAIGISCWRSAHAYARRPCPTPRRTSALSVLSADIQPAAAAPTPHAQMTLRVKKIACVSDTSELGKDEMLLGGQATMIATAADGTLATPVDSGTTAPIALGKFKRGDQKALNLVLSSFKLGGAASYPRVFNVSMLLVEQDFGETYQAGAVFEDGRKSDRKEGDRESAGLSHWAR